MRFFKKLPTISYNGYVAKNFLARARLTEDTRKNRDLFYPYTIQDHQRIDIIADKYYGDSDWMWLVYLANDIVDPYFDMYLPDTNFDSYITDKYGSIANAYQQIVYWKNNWEVDDSELDSATFEALPEYAKKYYTANIDRNNNAYGYVRKQEDWKVDTNQIVLTTVADVTGVFTIGERVTQKYSNNAIAANAVCTYANSTHMTFKHIVGEAAASNTTVTVTVTGLDSGATANIQTIASTLYSIPDTEAVYWSAVSAYEDEQFKNATKKTIDLIDVRYKSEVEKQLKKIMNG